MSSRAYLISWTLSLLVLVCQDSAVRAQQLSISDGFARSRLLSNLSKDASETLLQHLAEIAQAPANTPLRVVHELQHCRVAHAFLGIMQSHEALNASNITPWLDSLGTFLERYLHGDCPVHHGDLQLVLNQTAFSGLPMIRRSILAHLAAAWLTRLERSFPGEAQPKLEQLVRKLYRIHRDSVVQKGVMEYFHISKAGGTSWNSAAKLNGCVRARSAGSHVKGFGDECRWMDQEVYYRLTGRKILWGRWGRVSRASSHRGCRSRYDYVAARGFSYTSNEYTLQGGHDSVLDAHVCPQVINVVTLRDPLKRMESNLRFIMLHVKAAFRRRGNETAFEALFCDANAEFWRALGPPITDNYLVRSFLGEEGFHTAPGGIGALQLTAARHQLLTFDLVLDLDAGEGPNDRVAQQGLGWAAALSAAHALDSSVLTVRMQLNYSACHPEEGGMQQLRAGQGPDGQLYRFGRVVNQLDELWLDLARELGERPQLREMQQRAGEKTQQRQCGMLFRGSNNSALATAILRVTGQLGDGNDGGNGGDGVGASGSRPDDKRPKRGGDGRAGHLKQQQRSEEAYGQETEADGFDGADLEGSE